MIVYTLCVRIVATESDNLTTAASTVIAQTTCLQVRTSTLTEWYIKKGITPIICKRLHCTMFTLQWECNSSKYYDGCIQDVLVECILEEHRQRKAGECMQVEWERSRWLWNAVILDKQPERATKRVAKFTSKT